ncbi:MAG: response regulator [Colwelliaceae bacterium]|nr:response regulator [Colwelliaceae bacterium]
MRSNYSQDLTDQMKQVILGTQFTLVLISLYRAYHDDFFTSLILGATVIFLQVLKIVLKKGGIKLASNLFSIIIFSVAFSYMWTYEGIRDEVAFVLPSIIAFSLITGSRKTTIFLIISLIIGVLSLGHFTDIGIRAQTISTNNLKSSILILMLMCFGIFLYWTLFNYLVKALNKIKNTLSTQTAILNNLGDSLIITDIEGIILQVSKSSNILFGVNGEYLIGKSIFSLIPDANTAYQNISQNINGDRHFQQLQAYKDDGTQFDIKLVLTKTEVENEFTYIALISDISESLAVQKQLKLALESADKANQSKSEFLANMSHEIRTPMNGVMGSLQILERENLSENAKEMVKTAAISSSSLLTIINDILDLSKIEAEKLTLEVVPFNLSKIIDNLLNEIFELSQEKNNKITFTIQDSYREGWEGDPVRVKQIILNLLSNSIKFTLNGEINIVLGLASNGHLQISVKDTGIGMSQETINNLFIRFQQADNSTTRKFGGTGLGISITHSLVTLMKGTIDVRSELDKGTTFIITLPLKSNDSNNDTIKANEEIQVPDLTGRIILLAEDNRINQKIFENMMKATNAQIYMVENGIDAVEKSSKIDVDIIFMDIQMPEMDGREACKIIKKQKPLTPIIALTANIMVDDVKQYAIDGFDAHIGKPININELYRAINWYVL